MNKKLLFGFLFLILLVPAFASATTLTNNLFSYWKFDENTGTNIVDELNLNNGTLNGVSWNAGKINYGASFDGTNDYISLSATSSKYDYTTALSFGGWVNLMNDSTTTKYRPIFSKRTGANIDFQLTYVLVSSETDYKKLRLNYGGTSIKKASGTTDLTIYNDTWVYINVVVTGTRVLFYINGDLKDNISQETAITNTNLDTYIGRESTSYFYGKIDEVGLWNRALTSAEISKLYNSGTGLSYPFITNFTITTNLNNFNVSINGTLNYTSNTKTLTTGFELTDTKLYNITISANTYDTITYTNYNISLNGSITTTLVPTTKVYFNAFDVYNNEINDFNIIYKGTKYTSNDTIAISEGAGYHNFTFSKTNWYNYTQQFYLNTTTQERNFTNVYQTKINITLKDILTNATLTGAGVFNYKLNSNTYSATLTNGNAVFNSIYGSYSSITTTNDDYYLHNVNNFNISTTTYSATYYLYRDRSVWFSAKNFVSGVSLSNFSVSVYNTNAIYTGSGVSRIEINNITAGLYKVLFSKTGFEPAEYFITITNKSHQDLIAYMVNSTGTTTETTIFTLQDIVTTDIISGATISMYKLINNVWTLVSSKASDITGRSQFSYITGIEYSFVVTKEGYTQREFLLMPIYNSYTIRLTPTGEIINYYGVGSWSYYLSNLGIFYNDKKNEFDISISSGLGTIEYYNINISYPNSYNYINCINAYGCSESISADITNANFEDRVQIEINIKESGQNLKNFKYLYLIQDDYLNYTIWGWKDLNKLEEVGLRSGGSGNIEDIGDLEKVMIYLLITLILLGITATISVMLGTPTITITGTILTILTFTFALIGFIPMYSAYIVGLGVILIIFFGRGQI